MRVFFEANLINQGDRHRHKQHRHLHSERYVEKFSTWFGDGLNRARDEQHDKRAPYPWNQLFGKLRETLTPARDPQEVKIENAQCIVRPG